MQTFCVGMTEWVDVMNDAVLAVNYVLHIYLLNFIYFFCLVVKSVFSWDYTRYNYIICLRFCYPVSHWSNMNNYFYRLLFLGGFYLMFHILNFCPWEMLYHNKFLMLPWFCDSIVINVFYNRVSKDNCYWGSSFSFWNDWFWRMWNSFILN